MPKADDFLGPEPKRADDFLGGDMPSENPGFLQRLKRNYQSEVGQAVDTMKEGAGRVMDPSKDVGLGGRALGAGEALLGGVGYVASPLTSLTKTVVTDPVKVNAKNLGLPEGVSEFLGETAGAASDVFSGAGLAKAAPKLAKVATSAERAVKPVLSAIPKTQAPTRAAIKEASQKAYAAAEAKGGVIPKTDFNSFVTNVGNKIAEDFDQDLHPAVSQVMKSLERRAGSDQTISDLEKYRRILSKKETSAYKSNDADTGRIVGMVKDEVDDLIDSMPGGPEINQARELWKKNAQMRDIEQIETTAKVLGERGPPFVQQKFTAILKNPKKLGQYTPDQQKLIAKIANTGRIEGVARNLAPSGGWAGLLHGGSGVATGFGLGALSGGLPAASVGAVAVPATAMVVKGAGNVIRAGRLGTLKDTIARGEAAPGFLDRFRAERAKMRMTEP